VRRFRFRHFIVGLPMAFFEVNLFVYYLMFHMVYVLIILVLVTFIYFTFLFAALFPGVEN